MIPDGRGESRRRDPLIFIGIRRVGRFENEGVGRVVDVDDVSVIAGGLPVSFGDDGVIGGESVAVEPAGEGEARAGGEIENTRGGTCDGEVFISAVKVEAIGTDISRLLVFGIGIGHGESVCVPATVRGGARSRSFVHFPVASDGGGDVILSGGVYRDAGFDVILSLVFPVEPRAHDKDEGDQNPLGIT
jgi:hypothetical protein